MVSCALILGVSLILSTAAVADTAAAPSGAPNVVADAIQGFDVFVLNSEVASACGWTTKDHGRLEQARNTMIQNSLRLLVKQGDLSERELTEVFHTVTSTAYVADHALRALDLQKKGVCEDVQVKSQWNLIASSSMPIMLLSDDTRMAASLNPIDRIKSMLPFNKTQPSQP
jgi:hypothetical protein